MKLLVMQFSPSVIFVKVEKNLTKYDFHTLPSVCPIRTAYCAKPITRSGPREPVPNRRNVQRSLAFSTTYLVSNLLDIIRICSSH
jgi:hypothetical protein